MGVFVFFFVGHRLVLFWLFFFCLLYFGSRFTQLLLTIASCLMQQQHVLQPRLLLSRTCSCSTFSNSVEMLSTTVLLVFLFFSPPEGTAFSTSQRSHHVARHSVPFERAQFHGDFHKRVHAVAQIGKPSSDYSFSKVSPFRIAILLVWYGPNSAPKNIEFFLSSVAANANLVDLLLFHEGNSALEKTVSNAGQKNVHLIN